MLGILHKARITSVNPVQLHANESQSVASVTGSVVKSAKNRLSN